jgi:hypothetical protein
LLEKGILLHFVNIKGRLYYFQVHEGIIIGNGETIQNIDYLKGTSPTPANPFRLSSLVHVSPCTAELSLATLCKAYFLLYAEGGGGHDFFNAQAAIYARIGAADAVLTPHWNQRYRI